MTARTVFRIAIAAAAVIAASIVVVALRTVGGTDAAAWATVAAALAVMGALLSAWTSQRVFELQEDALLPHIAVTLDARSRAQLVMLRIHNTGASAAHDIRLAWNDPALTDEKGRAVNLGVERPITILHPGESATALLGVGHAFFGKHGDTTFGGTVSFATAHGHKKVVPFTISAEHERGALVHADELALTQTELQKIPERLDALARELRALGRSK